MAEHDIDLVIAIADSMPEAPKWPRNAYHRALDPSDLPQRIALVAELTSGAAGLVVAGFVIGSGASPLAPQAELELIAVAIKYQRNGLAKQLLSEWIEQVHAAGAEEALLELRSSNQPALQLYQKAGWNEVGIRRNYYANPLEDAIIMRLPLR